MKPEQKGRPAGMLEVKNLKKTFHTGHMEIPAVSGISFSVAPGEWVGLVGESGSGKSTAAAMIARILDSDAGKLLYDQEDYTMAKGRKRKEWYQKIQMIFQAPADSFDPRKTLGYSLAEGLRNRKVPKEEAFRRAEEMMESCGLSPEYRNRYPHQVSGGECQRAAIARALLLEPELLICDEITSALDVTVQAQIIGLLQKIKKERQLSCLFISHDLALVQELCERILVMYQGKIVEAGSTEQVIGNPREDYTKRLLDSVPEYF